MIGSLFFEVEGVLANTQPLRRAALERALADEGLVPEGFPAVVWAVDAGDGSRESVQRVVRNLPIAQDETAITLLAHRADANFAALLRVGVSLAPGARELVEQAAGRCRLAIVTGLDLNTVDTLLALAQLDGAFEVIVAAENVAAAKPAPDGHRKAIERLAKRRPLNMSASLALESSTAGTHAAHIAGLRSILIAPFDVTVSGGNEADAILTSLVGQTLSSLNAMLTLKAAG